MTHTHVTPEKLPHDPAPKNFRVLLVYTNHMFVNVLPSSIGILTACLRNNGFEVGLFDTTFYQTTDRAPEEVRVETLQVRKFDLSTVGINVKPGNYTQEFAAAVDAFKPDLIGISCVEETFFQVLAMLEAIRGSGIPTIVGGIFTTMAPELALAQEDINTICVGEGEHALIELCYRLWRKQDISDIRNLWLKRDGQIIRNPLRPPIDLEDVPFADWTLFEQERFYRPMQGKVMRMLSMEFDRGCPFQCRFCCAPSLSALYREQTGEAYLRIKSLDRIRREFEHFTSVYKPEYYYFNSETFLAMGDEAFEQFAEMYRAFGLPFWMQTRVETITEKKIRILESMNCNRISFGIEHGNEEFRRKILKKNFTNQEAIEKLGLFRNSSIPITVSNIVGFPGETRELIFDTIELSRQLPADSFNCFYYSPFRGTSLFKEAAEKGYIGKDHTFARSLLSEPNMELPTISRQELMGLVRTFSLYVRFPKEEWPLIRRAESFDDEGNRVFEQLTELYYERFFNK